MPTGYVLISWLNCSATLNCKAADRMILQPSHLPSLQTSSIREDNRILAVPRHRVRWLLYVLKPCKAGLDAVDVESTRTASLYA